MEDDTYLVVIATREGMRDKFLSAWNHCESILANGGSGVQLSVGPSIEPVTVLQHRFFHGPVLRQISEQVEVAIFDANGVDTGRRSRHVAAIWKRYFKERFLGFKTTHERRFVVDKETGLWRPAKKATPHREIISITTLGPAKMAKFIDKVIDHAVTEFHVEFVFKPREREEVRYVTKPRNAQRH